MIRRQIYYIKNAFKCMTRNSEMTLTAVLTVTSCLLLFGVFMLLSVNVNNIGQQIRNQCEIQAYIDIEATTSEEQAVVNAIKALPNVKGEPVFVSKSQAMVEFKEYLGEDGEALDDLDGEEFLSASVKISMDNIEESKVLADAVAKIPNVSKVSNRQDILQRVIDVTDAIKVGSLGAMLILLIVAIFIIPNTIKLSVVARKDEIHIMKYVGATASFVRRPFIYEGILTGVVGGLVSLAITGFGYNAVIKSLEGFLDIFDLIPFIEILPFMVATTLIFGILMGAIGSAIALMKHLKV